MENSSPQNPQIRWGVIYAVVIGALIIEIILMYWFSQYFS